MTTIWYHYSDDRHSGDATCLLDGHSLILMHVVPAIVTANDCMQIDSVVDLSSACQRAE